MFLFLYFPFCFPGVNTVLKSVILKPGDGVLATNITYRAVANTCQHVCDKVPGEFIFLKMCTLIDLL